MKYHPLIAWCLVIFGSLFTVMALLYQGYFSIHDDVQVVRVFQMTQALQNGQFPVRWVQDLGYGYGYPLYNFYAPLPYYIGSLFDIAGLTPLAATKTMMGIGMVLGAVTMFLLGSRVWGVWGGLICSMVYTYAPYHAVQLYVRGSIGELYAYAFIPLMIYGLIGIVQSSKIRLRDFTALVIGYAGIILSHNITALLVTVLTGIGGALWIVFQVHDTKYITRTTFMWGIGAGLIALGCAAFFWLPALAESSYTRVDTLITGGSDYHVHFLYADQLWDSPWGFAGSGPGRTDGMSFKISKLLVILGSIGLVEIVIHSKQKKAALVSLILCVIAVLMTLEYSVVIWESVPFLAYVQFPWRFLVFIVFILSIWSGGIVLMNFVTTRLSILLAIGVAGLFVMIHAKYFVPQNYYRYEQSTYENTAYINWEKSRISDEYLPRDVPLPQSEDEIGLLPESSPFTKQLTDSPVQKTANIISLISVAVFFGTISRLKGFYGKKNTH